MQWKNLGKNFYILCLVARIKNMYTNNRKYIILLKKFFNGEFSLLQAKKKIEK